MRFTLITVCLCAAIYILQPGSIGLTLGMIPATGQSYRTVTYMWIHADILHLLANMIFLAVFGLRVERRLGSLALAGLYISSGVAGAVAIALLAPRQSIPAVGASAAVSGVLGAYLILFGHERVSTRLIGWTVAFPVWVGIAMWPIFSILTNRQDIAQSAHLTGLAVGAGITAYLVRLFKIPYDFTSKPPNGMIATTSEIAI